MKEVMAIVRMNMMNKTKKALTEAGIFSMTARDALGRGKGLVDASLLAGAEKGYEEAISQIGPEPAAHSQKSPDRRRARQTGPEDGEDVDPGKPDGKIRRREDFRHARSSDSVSIRTGISGDSVLDDA